MIDITKAKKAFKLFLERYKTDEDVLGFELKIVHTYHVVDNARLIAEKLKLSDEDIKLAELIALLHDTGRFEEITYLKQFDNATFNHAEHGVKMLFEQGLIREFIKDDSYDEIIKVAIANHNRLAIEDGLDERALLHAKIIRDADKLDNFRVKKEEKIEAIFPGRVKDKEHIETSTVSDKVYETVLNKECVNIYDRQTALDCWVCVLAFVYDLNFKETFEIIKENNYIDVLIDRFAYVKAKTKERMETIRGVIKEYIEEGLK
ncbi:MAG: HD domain-containing protein [Clostridia bacterium]|nr:HD domain-containing protein [Clostridia bacterium]